MDAVRLTISPDTPVVKAVPKNLRRDKAMKVSPFQPGSFRGTDSHELYP